MGSFGLPALPGIENVAYDPQNPNAGLSPSSPYYIPQVLNPNGARPYTAPTTPAAPLSTWQSIIAGITGGLDSGAQSGAVINTPGTASNPGAAGVVSTPAPASSDTTVRFAVGIIGLLFVAGGIFMLSISGIEGALNSDVGRTARKGAALLA